MLYKQKENRQHLKQVLCEQRNHRQHLEQFIEKRVEQLQQLVLQVLHTTFTSQGGDQEVLCGGSEVIIITFI